MKKIDIMESQNIQKKIGVGCGILVLRNNKVLLGLRNSDPSKAKSALHGEGTWTCPGGKMDFGESFEEVSKRELKEETDMELHEIEVICVNNEKVSDAHFITLGILAKKYSGEPKAMEPDEISEWRWFDLNNLPSPLYFPSEHLIENYKKDKFYIKRD